MRSAPSARAILLFHAAMRLAVVQFDRTEEAILSRSRSRTLVLARAFISYVMRQEDVTLPMVGELMGRDHSSVIKAIEKFSRMLDSQDPSAVGALLAWQAPECIPTGIELHREHAAALKTIERLESELETSRATIRTLSHELERERSARMNDGYEPGPQEERASLESGTCVHGVPGVDGYVYVGPDQCEICLGVRLRESPGCSGCGGSGWFKKDAKRSVEGLSLEIDRRDSFHSVSYAGCRLEVRDAVGETLKASVATTRTFSHEL